MCSTFTDLWHQLSNKGNKVVYKKEKESPLHVCILSVKDENSKSDLVHQTWTAVGFISPRVLCVGHVASTTAWLSLYTDQHSHVPTTVVRRHVGNWNGSTDRIWALAQMKVNPAVRVSTSCRGWARPSHTLFFFSSAAEDTDIKRGGCSSI